MCDVRWSRKKYFISHLRSHISFTASVSPKFVETLLEVLHRNGKNDGLANFGDKDKVTNISLDLLVLFQGGQQ
jgi:hypothetical protein